MRPLLIVALLLISAQQASAISVVQRRNNQSVGTLTTISSTQSMTTVVAGNLVVLTCYSDASASSSFSASDSNSQSYSTVTTSAVGTGVETMFYKENSAAITTVSCNNTQSGTMPAVMEEISGIAISSSLDASATSSGSAASTSLASGTLSTVATNEILVYGVGKSTTEAGSWTNGSGYTIFQPNPQSRSTIQDKIVSATQSSTSTTMSWPGSNSDRVGILATFSATSIVAGTGCKGTRMALTGAGC